MKKKEIIVNVDAKAVLSKVSRMFDNTPQGLLLEICQNARRAGATEIKIDASKDDELTMTHDGAPFSYDDLNALFTLGSSGWSDDDIQSEDPAGAGFFALTMFDRVTVKSAIDGGRISVTASKDQLTEAGSKLAVEFQDKKLPEGVNVVMRMEGKHGVCSAEVKHVARHFPIPIRNYNKEEQRYIGVRNCREHALSRAEHALRTDVKHNVRFMLFDTEGFNVEELPASTINIYAPRHASWGTPRLYLNYHGHVFELDNELHTLYTSVLEHISVAKYSTHAVMIFIEEGSDIRMVLPARITPIQDQAYETLKQDFLDFLIEYVNSLPGHDFPYYLYRQLGGACKLRLEARKPEVLKDAPKGTPVLKDGGMDEAVRHLMHNDPGNVLVCKGVTQYEGYSWYEEFDTFDSRDLYLRVNGEKVDDCFSGGCVADSIELVREFPDGGADMVVSNKHNTALYSEYTLDGPELYEFSFWRLKDTDPQEVVDALYGYMADVWEPNYDNDADSSDTQRDEFETSALEQLRDLFLPDMADKLKLRQFVEKYRWELNVVKQAAFWMEDGSYLEVDIDSLGSLGWEEACVEHKKVPENRR